MSNYNDVLCTGKKVAPLRYSMESFKNEHAKSDSTKIKTWMTDDILKMMEKRKIVQCNPDERKSIDKEIKNKIREAKEKEIQEKYDE